MYVKITHTITHRDSQIVDWKYVTSNEDSACLSANGSYSWPAWRNLGGNTMNNGMMFI